VQHLHSIQAKPKKYILGGFSMFDNPFAGFFYGMPAFFVFFFVLILAIVVITIIKNIVTWLSNNQQPRLSVKAAVMGKRTRTFGGNQTTVSTHYYVTFEVASGDRMELKVNGRDYGQIAEGDQGVLEFQGTRYLDFQRSTD
jgi:hypothetical protein